MRSLSLLVACFIAAGVAHPQEKNSAMQAPSLVSPHAAQGPGSLPPWGRTSLPRNEQPRAETPTMIFHP